MWCRHSPASRCACRPPGPPALPLQQHSPRYGRNAALSIQHGLTCQSRTWCACLCILAATVAFRRQSCECGAMRAQGRPAGQPVGATAGSTAMAGLAAEKQPSGHNPVPPASSGPQQQQPQQPPPPSGMPSAWSGTSATPHQVPCCVRFAACAWWASPLICKSDCVCSMQE